MKKKSVTALLMMLCLLLFLHAVPAETREGVIALEGQNQTIEETLYKSTSGFSFWYANELLEAYPGEMDNIEGVVVDTVYSNDYMVLSMIPEEDAEAYDRDISKLSEETRIQMEVYRKVDQGRIHFMTLIAENGQYLRAVGEYNLEAAEGNAKYFDRVLDSVTFTPDCPILATWGPGGMDEDGHTVVILKALEPVSDIQLLSLDWDGITVSWIRVAPIGSLNEKQSVSITVEFIGDMPSNGIMYTDATGIVHTFALDISGEDGHLFFWNLEE